MTSLRFFLSKKETTVPVLDARPRRLPASWGDGAQSVQSQSFRRLGGCSPEASQLTALFSSFKAAKPTCRGSTPEIPALGKTHVQSGDALRLSRRTGHQERGASRFAQASHLYKNFVCPPAKSERGPGSRCSPGREGSTGRKRCNGGSASAACVHNYEHSRRGLQFDDPLACCL